MKKLVKLSKEFTLKAFHLSKKSDTIQDIATSLRINGGLLYRWRKEHFDRSAKGEVFPGVGKSAGILNPEREKLKKIATGVI